METPSKYQIALAPSDDEQCGIVARAVALAVRFIHFKLAAESMRQHASVTVHYMKRVNGHPWMNVHADAFHDVDDLCLMPYPNKQIQKFTFYPVHGTRVLILGDAPVSWLDRDRFSYWRLSLDSSDKLSLIDAVSRVVDSMIRNEQVETIRPTIESTPELERILCAQEYNGAWSPVDFYEVASPLVSRSIIDDVSKFLLPNGPRDLNLTKSDLYLASTLCGYIGLSKLSRPDGVCDASRNAAVAFMEECPPHPNRFTWKQIYMMLMNS